MSKKNKLFQSIDPSYFHLVSQEGIRHKLVEGEDRFHNAIWDYQVGPDGRHWFAVCAEIAFPGFVRLYEYLPETGDFKCHFRLEDVIVTYPRAIRPSKFHSSINFLPDGRLIMMTHTTAGAPNHPSWFPVGFATHQWEGYFGSNLLIYDPKTGKVEDLGIPVPRTSAYGGVYCAKTNSYYFSDYLRGHIYKINLNNRHVKDYGQCIEGSNWRLLLGRDNNVYFTTKTGELFRVNTETDVVEDLHQKFPVNETSPTPLMLEDGLDGPDGRLYMVSIWGCKSLMAYNYETGKLEEVGDMMPPSMRGIPWSIWVQGLAFDKNNVLWYCSSMNADEPGEPRTGVRLMSWDFFNGKEPEDHGLLGTRERCIHQVSDARIHNDHFIITDTNHIYDAAGILDVDLESVRRNKGEPTMSLDFTAYTRFENGVQVYSTITGQDVETLEQEQNEQSEHTREAILARFDDANRQNPYTFSPEKILVCKLWRYVGFEESQVRELSYDAQGRVIAVCGNTKFARFIIENGKVAEWEDNISYTPTTLQQTAEKFAHLTLPGHSGRQYRALAESYCTLADGKTLVGTQDGMLALVDGDKVFNLGAVSMSGGIHSLAASPDGTLVYGVAGDPEDLGMVFQYSVESGIKMLGCLSSGGNPIDDNVAKSSEPCCVAFAPDGKSIAIGVRDRMGCVYYCVL